MIELSFGVEEAYKQRPPYQQNDYLGWILKAKRLETREKRIAQMLAELRSGDKYMGMDYRPKRLSFKITLLKYRCL